LVLKYEIIAKVSFTFEGKIGKRLHRKGDFSPFYNQNYDNYAESNFLNVNTSIFLSVSKKRTVKIQE